MDGGGAGMVYGYLHGGSPSVVANLWDVTDKDIDRFSVELLTHLLPSATGATTTTTTTPVPLLDQVAKARSACKLPYLVGAAPVCYGIPIQFIRHPPPPK